MSFDSEEENYFSFTKHKFVNEGVINKDIIKEYDNIELVGNNKTLDYYKIYENCNMKKHKKEYAFIEVIELKNYPNPFYFSITRVLLLLDEILGVDVMCIGNYHPFESQNDLKYILGHDDQHYLFLATVRCKEILLDKIKFESTIIFKTCYNKKLTRIYLKDFGYKEEPLAIEAIKESINGNDTLKGIDIKIRGRHSGYIEDSLNMVSPENTYIQIIHTDINFCLNECIHLLNNLKRFLI